MIETYAEHYRACQKEYRGDRSESLYSSAYDVTFDTNLLELDEEYYELIDDISAEIKQKIESNDGCFEDEHAIRLNDWRNIDEIGWLADIIMPQLEEKVFHSYLNVEFIHPYRNKTVESDPINSWLWHYDDCPREFLKLMINLNDVKKDNGCMQYIRNSDERVTTIESSRVGPRNSVKKVYDKSRIPMSVIDNKLASGAQICDFVGKKGSYALFTPNIMHRATVPSAETVARDVITFFIRPSMRQKNDYVIGANSYKPERDVKAYVLN